MLCPGPLTTPRDNLSCPCQVATSATETIFSLIGKPGETPIWVELPAPLVGTDSVYISLGSPGQSRGSHHDSLTAFVFPSLLI